jgi:ABC-type antimicrobial peptide transport system permease subunit
MIRNYFITAWRNLLRDKLYSAINIGGLAIGMAVSFLLLLYVYNEFSYDKFNVNADRLYKVFFKQSSNGNITTGNTSPAPLASALKKDFAEIANVARTDFPNDVLINYQDKSLKVNTMAADESILDMFSFDFIYGNHKNALSQLSSIILTQSVAKAIFGNTDPIGKVVQFDNKYPLTVSAVIKDNPQNSSFGFKALLSWRTMENQRQWVKNSDWGGFSFSTYVMLKPGTKFSSVDEKVKKIFSKYSPQNKNTNFFLYPYTNLHLYGEFKNGIYVGGSIEYVRLFFFLAIGILLIASINFMNLSTARSERRAREVGVRKAIGARRFALIQQFMSESVLMAFLAFGVSLILMVSLLPFFNNIINLHLELPYGNIYTWVVVIGVTLLTGLIAGSYPALFLSSFNPVKVLKGQFGAGKASARPRHVLVVVQFTFTISLILSSIFIYKQINHIKNRPVGYNQNNLIEMPLEGNLITKFKGFREDALNTEAIIDGATTSGSIININGDAWGIKWPGQLPGEEMIPIDQMAVSHHFINTYGLSLTEGRDFAIGRSTDSSGVILNEAAVELMRLKNPLGQLITWQGEPRPVIGVVKNFVWGSPYEPVKPAIIGFMKDWKDNIALRLNPKISASKSLSTLQGLYQKYNPNYPFEYKFTDERFGNKFKTEKLLGTMSVGFTGLAIIVSCLGLFGLALFSAEQRKKEISIRKVLGASVSNLWFSMSRQFVALVMLSFIIGSAISWYNINQWLGKYTYHTSLSIWVFVITMLVSVALCLIAVSFQSIKAAIANPVKNLRSE